MAMAARLGARRFNESGTRSGGSVRDGPERPLQNVFLEVPSLWFGGVGQITRFMPRPMMISFSKETSAQLMNDGKQRS